MDTLQIMSSQFGLNKTDFIKALTHYSFYEAKDENKGNSRLIFAGMFVFRGQLADILFKYYSASGTQLQHILGNLLKNDYFNILFDKWTLKKWVRAGEKFDINAHKHIFVYAIMGLVSQIDEEKRNRFVFKYIINSDTEYVLKHVLKNKDLFNQTKFISLKSFGKKITVKMKVDDQGMHHATVLFEDKTVLCDASSKSYRYARKKAMKLAMKILADINFEKYINESDYLERIIKRVEKENQKQKLELQSKLAEKREKRLENIERAKRIKNARDLARKNTQAEAKKRKEERKALLAKKVAKEQRPVSAKKRRFLEDKKK